MNLELLKEVIADQYHELLEEKGDQEIPREIDTSYHVRVPEVSIITGVRRSGKSTLLRQIAREVKDTCNIHYLDFEEHRLSSFTVDDFRVAYEEFLLNAEEGKKQVLMYDEIQNIEKWEKWVSSISSKRNVKVFITGSNSSLLSSELSSLVTGRHVDFDLTPLSFKESLHLFPEHTSRDISNKALSKNKLLLKKACENYFEYGGFPRALLYKDTYILGQYYNDIIERDIVIRRKIRNVKALRNLGILLSSQNGRIINQSATSRDLSIKSVITTNKFINYFKETFLYSEVRLYSKSAKKQLRGYSKFYCVDPVLAKRTGQHHGDTLYWVLENHIFNELKRRGYEVYYWHSSQGFEVDFIVRDRKGKSTIIQVTVDMSSNETYKREIRGIEEAGKALKIDTYLIITYFEQSAEVLEKCPYKILPFYHWALGDE